MSFFNLDYVGIVTCNMCTLHNCDGGNMQLKGQWQEIANVFPAPSKILDNPAPAQTWWGIRWSRFILGPQTPHRASPVYVPIPHQRSGHMAFLNDFLRELGTCASASLWKSHVTKSILGKENFINLTHTRSWYIFQDWLRLINIYIVGTVALIYGIPR
jgi:hypothetical protein